MRIRSQILEGEGVRLEPLTAGHREGLVLAVRDGRLWELPTTFVPDEAGIDGFIDAANAVFDRGEGLAFAAIDICTGNIAGSTRFMNASDAHKSIEIGHTFLAGSYQRTLINTESKLLLMTHAFESLGVNRLEFKTDVLNLASRQAILRLGAKEEGILRQHMVMPDGRVRDTVLFSVVKEEWPTLKQGLIQKLT